MSHLDGFGGADLAVGSVFGLRRFKVDEYGRLIGYSYDSVWAPGENVAACRKDDSSVGWFTTGGTITFHTTNFTSNTTNDPAPATVPVAPEVIAEVDTSHDAPHPSCGCGFWAYYGDPANYGRGSHTIVGVVAAYGRVLIGPRGFRAEKAKIVALRIKPGRKGRGLIIRNYPDVPIFASRTAMLAEFPTSVHLMPTPDSDPEFWTRPAVTS